MADKATVSHQYFCPDDDYREEVATGGLDATARPNCPKCGKPLQAHIQLGIESSADERSDSVSMTIEQAREVVHEAMLAVDPNYEGDPGRIGGTGVRVEQRGERFDVMLLHSGYLFAEFEAAIRAALGHYYGSVREVGSTNSTPPFIMVPVVSSVNNYAPVGSQQFGNHNTAYVTQLSTIDQRNIAQTVQLVRDHLPELPPEEREEVEHHLETITGELHAQNPRPPRIKAALGAIRRVVISLAGMTGKAVLETAIETAMKSCLGNGG